MEEYKCKFCFRLCKNLNSLSQHECRCKLNDSRILCNGNFGKTKGYTAWNKGKTKSTDDRIKAYSETIKLKYESGELVPSFLNRKHSERSKHLIKESQQRNYENCSRWFTQIENRKSYAEQYFEHIFPSAKRNYHVNKYFLDFAWPEKMIYFEVDGEQHYSESGIAHDTKRTEVLKSLGWRIISRCRWSHFKSLCEKEKQCYVNVLKIIVEQ